MLLLVAVFADHPSVLVVSTVVAPHWLLDAVGQGALLSRAPNIVHVDGSQALSEVCHDTCLGLTTDSPPKQTNKISSMTTLPFYSTPQFLSPGQEVKQ